MRRFVTGLALTLTLTLALAGCVQNTARSRLKGAMEEAGLSEPVAACMAKHLVDKLSIRQLRKLSVLRGVGRDPLQYALAIRRIDDPEVISVSLSATAICMAGRGAK